MRGKVSLIIPLFNREALIAETLRSVLDQTYANFECIVIDDGSTDDSIKVARNVVRDDKRFLISSRISSIKGACECRNEGIALASGVYIMFLDSDDLLAQDCLKNRVQKLDEHQTCDFIVNQIAMFDHQTYRVTSLWSSLKHDDDLYAFLYSEGWQTSSTFFRSSFLKKYRFDEHALSWQDVDFHIRILLDAPTYVKYPDMQPDVYMRHSGLERISNTNVSFARIESRMNLYCKLEQIMESKAYHDYKEPFTMYYFKFLEIAALVLSYAEFKRLFLLWRPSKTFHQSKTIGFRLYLSVQAHLKKLRLSLLCSVLYRVIRLFINRKLLNPDHRKVLLKQPIIIPRERQIDVG